jgi:hypothetical protein
LPPLCSIPAWRIQREATEVLDAAMLAQALLEALFDLLLSPFAHAPAAAGLVWISALAGAALAALFKAATHQELIGRIRRSMGGTAAGLLLHLQDPRAVAAIGLRLLAANGRYLLAMAPALLAASLPFLIFLGQVQARFGYRAPTAGDTVLVVFTRPSGSTGDQISASGAASGVQPIFRSGDGRTTASRIVFAEAGVARVVLGGDTLFVGRSGNASPVGRALMQGFTLESLVRPDIELARGGRATAEAVLEPHRYLLFSRSLSEVILFLIVSTFSAVVAGAILRVKI